MKSNCKSSPYQLKMDFENPVDSNSTSSSSSSSSSRDSRGSRGKPWPLVKLGDVCEVRAGSTHHGIEVLEGGYPVYGSGGLIGRASEWRCPANTVIVGRKGTLDNPMLIKEPFWNIDTCFGLICKERLLPEYLLFFCRITDFYTLVPSSGRPSTTSDSIKNLKIPLPPLDVQREIVMRLETELSRIDDIIKELQRGLSLCVELRKAILKEAFE